MSAESRVMKLQLMDKIERELMDKVNDLTASAGQRITADSGFPAGLVAVMVAQGYISYGAQLLGNVLGVKASDLEPLVLEFLRKVAVASGAELEDLEEVVYRKGDEELN